MKHPNISLLLLILSLPLLSLAQGWERTFQHETGWAKGFDVIQTADKGYVMVGEVDLPTGAIRHYLWLVKTDYDGDTLWSKVAHEWAIANESARAIFERPNGDLFIAGSNGQKARVWKYNANGDSLWTRDFGGDGINAFHGMAQNSLGNLILVGQYEDSLASSQQEVWVMGMDTTGDSLWSQTYFTPSFPSTSAMEIRPLSANDFLISGSIGGQGFAMEIDGSDGTQVWAKTYQFSTGDRLFSAAANEGGTSLLMGGNGTGFAGHFPILFETDLLGNITDTLGVFSVPFGAIASLAPTLDTGFILTGSTYDFWTNSSDIGFITKLDANHDVEWEFTFADSLDMQGAAIIQDSDGNFVLAGSRQGGLWLKKIANPSTSIDEEGLSSSRIRVYPNPAQHTINVEFLDPIPANRLSISFFDMVGSLVSTHPISNSQTHIEVERFPRGIYQYQIHTSRYRFGTGKLILR